MPNPPLPDIVGAAEWNDRLATLRKQEEALTAARMELAAMRRQMPMTKVEKEYRFIGPDGEVGLAGLFGPHRQLVTYRFFYGPGAPNWPDGACPGCSMFAESVTHPAHLAARDVALAFVSDAPQDRIETYRERMGWITPWYTLVGEDFSRDFGVDEWFGINIFLRDGDDVYRTYFLNGPEVEAIGPVWTFLDLVPYGRQVEGEDSPDGYPQGDPYAWYRLHDEYA
jgi:predicted dithiol-disulfide oxidoreductase (DUF899 family)